MSIVGSSTRLRKSYSQNIGEAPKLLWDFCGEWVAAIRWLTARDTTILPGLEGCVPEERMTGNTSDILEYCQFDWYEVVWYNDNGSFPDTRKKLGKWVGVAHDVGSPMCSWIIPESCVPIPRTSVSLLPVDEAASPEIIMKLIKVLDKAELQLQSYPNSSWNI
jgi:hypothetical protein